MSEYASREISLASPSPPSASQAGSTAQTPSQRASETIARCAREVIGFTRAVEAVRTADAANDVHAWHEAREHAVRDLASVERSLGLACTQQHDAPPASLPQLAAAEASLGTAKAQLEALREPPRGYRAITAEPELIAILTKPMSGPANDAWAERERELKVVLDGVSIADSRTLADRLRRSQPGDPFVDALARMVPKRRARIATFLDDARRREAVRAAAPEPVRDEPTSLKHTRLGDYLRINSVDMRIAIANHLQEVSWPSPASDVDFLARGERIFVDRFMSFFSPHLDSGEELPQLLHPSDLQSEFEKLAPSGHRWSPLFGTATAQAVEASAKAALHRLGPRYRAALVRRGHRPDADDLVASHPIDPMVAAAMVAPEVLPDEPPEGAAQPVVETVAKVQAHWLGRKHRELWNFVEVSPASANVEDVAATLWGDERKSTMAFAIRKYGDVFRVAPEYARPLIEHRYRGEVISAIDVDNASQIAVLARSTVRSGDAPAREIGGSGEQATPEQIAAIEASISNALDAIRDEVTPLGMKDALLPAYTARMARLATMSSADAAARSHWLPVLQFQHTQLLAIDKSVKPLTTRIRSLDRAAPERENLVETLQLYVQAAAVSHLRDESMALVKTVGDRAHMDARRATDGAVRELQEGTQEAVNTPKGSVEGSEQARVQAESARQAVLNGHAQAPQEQQKALLVAGEVALRSRMRGAEHALDQLYAVASEVFGDPEKSHQMFPRLRNYTEVVGDVRAHLADVQKAWDAATKAGTPANGDGETAQLQGRAAGLTAARDRFAKIAGDKSLSEFIDGARKKIQDQRIISSLVSLGINLALTVLGGMGAAGLGAKVAGALVGEAAGLAATAARIGIDIAVTVSVNSAVQLALSGGEASLGWTLLENALMEVFTRGLGGGLRRLETAARREGQALAELPHLAASDRAALTTVDFSGAQLLVDSIGGMAAQWAAHRLVSLVHSSGEAASESFAMTVLQQGAAIGLGKFFHGRYAKWKSQGALLARMQIGQLPEMRALLAEGETFFSRAIAAEHDLSPEPGLADLLIAQHMALIERTTAVLAAHSEMLATSSHAPKVQEHAPSETSTRAPAGDAPMRGDAIATLVGGARYESGEFAVATDAGETRVQIRRTDGSARLRGVGSTHVVLEVPRGIAGVELERAVVGKLTELREAEALRARGLAAPTTSGLGEHGSGAQLSPADRGKVAELRVLRERHREAKPDSPEATKLEKAVAALEKEMGLLGEDGHAQKRRAVVESQIDVQDDASRRTRARRELDGERGHPGVELHSHFFGVIDAVVFRDRAASASGHAESKSWMPLLERITSLKGAEFEHTTGPDGQVIRATAGDAVRIAEVSRKQARALIDRSAEKGTSPQDGERLRELGEEVAEDGCRAALAATEETDFNSAYEIRDELVKTTFGGESKNGETRQQAKQRAYDDMIRETLLQLARDGISYAEQSTSLNKLATVTTPERVQTILRELVREGKIADGAVDVRMLGMMHTSRFGTREGLPPVKAPGKAGFEADVDATTRAVEHPGTVGNDVGGPESFSFDKEGIARFQTVYEALLQRALATGEPMVFRPHVGEGAVDTEANKPFHTDQNRHIGANDEPSHYQRAEDNIGKLLEALDGLGDKRDPAKVLVRLGHVTHATPEQARRMRDLGVIAEVNLGSNVVSGSLSQTEGASGPRAKAERLDDHSLPSLLYYDVTIAISTDAGGVMSTTLRQEYERANQLIEDVLAGRKPIRIRATDAMAEGNLRGKAVSGDETQRELTIDELNSVERGKFLHAYEKLYADARSYYLARPKPQSAGAGSATADATFGGAHHLSIAKGKGLIPTQNARIYEGVRADVEAAASEYRSDVGYKVFETGLDDGVAMFKVTSNDERFSVVLRSWKQEGPGYRSMSDQKHPNNEVRHWYHEQLARIAPLNDSWAAAGVPLVERAHRAYQIRQQARLAARERMKAKNEVKGLRDRDFAEYQDADGSSFAALLAHYQGTGMTRDQALAEVIASAQRSSEEYNRKAAASGEKPQ